MDTTPATTNEQPTNPRIRRHGFTPRTTSSTAHAASAVTPTQPIVVRAAVSLGTTQRSAAATRKIANDAFGTWVTVMRPVWRLRNSQSKTAAIAGQYRPSCLAAAGRTQAGQKRRDAHGPRR